ncbi:MAG: hypothetical protein M1829_006346 [Trizodia sp. TS-e1964]|nr:MAG: hypothetical protein M1829_006346 [Trizodia sp. TS-e1964]
MALINVERRQIAVPQALTSWDNCMANSYCKWPVIAGCIIGGFIALSIVWCIASASCCCSCARCCSCCGPWGSRRAKYSQDDSAYRSQPNNGYIHPSPQVFQPPPPNHYAQQGYHAPPAQPTYEPPQFATFDVRRDNQPVIAPGPINEDSLPVMPSWEHAPSKKVLVEEEHSGEAVELGELHPSVSQRKPLPPSFSPLMSGGRGPSPVLLSSQISSPYQNNYHPARDVNFESSMAHHQNQQFSPQASHEMYASSPPLHSQAAHSAYEDRSQQSVSPVLVHVGSPSSYQPQLPPQTVYQPVQMPQEPVYPHHHPMSSDGYSDAGYGATRRPTQPPYAAYSPSPSAYMR